MSEESKNELFAVSDSIPVYPYNGRLYQDDFDGILLHAIKHKASDITFQTNLVVMAIIAGRQQRLTQRRLSEAETDDITRWIYGDNGPGQIRSGQDIDEAYEIKNPLGGRYRFRVNITGGLRSFQITIRTLPSSPIEISRLGVEQDILDNVRPNDGIILVTGVTGSGKSTLLHSILRYIMENPRYSEKVLEYSKPIEFVHTEMNYPNSFIHAVQVGKDLRPKPDGNAGNSGDDGEWANCVRNSLRRAPTIILVGEARDRATMSACLEVALTGHLLFSSLHSIGVAETIRRALMPFPSNEKNAVAIDLLESVRMIVSQTLLERIDGGRVGCREYLVFDNRIRNALLSIDCEEWPQKIREIMRGGNAVCSTMSNSAKKLLEEGIISHETYEYIATRSSSESKLIRDVQGTNLVEKRNVGNTFLQRLKEEE